MERIGVELVAEGADAYLRTLAQTSTEAQKLLTFISGDVKAVNALDDSMSAGAKSADSFGDDVGRAADKVSLMDKVATGAAERVGHLLTDGFAQAGQAVLQFATDGVKKAGDFESGMNRFAAVTGDALADSGQSLNDFKDLFISLGRDLPVSTAAVQDAAINLAKGGIDPATIAAGGLKTALDLAAAGELDIAQAAEISAKQLGVWVDRAADAGTKAQFMTETADLLSQAANASTVDVDELALGLANVGGVAKTSGLTFRDTVQTMALLAPGFSSAADAGTSLKTMLLALNPKTDQASQAMARLGLLTAQGTSKFYDAQGSFIGMDKAAGLLHDSLQGLSQAEKTAALQAIFGTDAFRAAALLAEQGSKGFEEMGVSMGKAGTAAAQAAAKQQGWNVAVDNLMGSLEALQITVGTGALPALTKFVNLLAKGINVITDYADATIRGETALAKVATTIHDLVVPALAAATAGAIAYGVTAIAPLLVNIPAMTAVLLYNTAGLVANAAAAAAAVAPYALIAVAIGGVVYAYQNLQKKLSDATTQLLQSKQWWNDSSAAIDNYATKTGDAKRALEPYAATIQAIRDQIEGEVRSLGERQVAGTITQGQIEKELAVIQQHRDALKTATAAYTDQEQAILKQAAANMTATTAAQGMTSATAELGSQASLTAKDIENLGKQIDTAYAKGQAAVQGYATNQSTFLAGVEQRQQDHAAKIAELEKRKAQATTEEQRKGFDDQIAAAKQAYKDQETTAASSYARQQAEQQQHLGQMLIDYTVAQAQLGNIAKDKAAEITAALEKEYGLQESSVATTFLKMAGSIDKFANSSGQSVDALTKDLKDQQQQAADTQRAMDGYAKEYTAKAVNNFVDAKGDAMDYVHALEDIPKEVQTTVTITKKTIETYERHAARDDEPQPRASGGPMDAMRPYLVGERGPEIIVPQTSGTVIPASETRAAMQSVFGGGGASTTTATTNIYVDARGSSMTATDVQNAVQAGLRAEGNTADIRVRAGAW